VIHAPSTAPTELVALETAGYKALLTLLAAELEALLRLDPEAIASAAAAKQAQVQSLEQVARNRRDALAAKGLPETAEGITVWLAEVLDAAAARHAWGNLVELARAAHDANRRNGRVIERQRSHYDAALAALLGAAGVPAVYGADGRPQAGAARRTLATI